MASEPVASALEQKNPMTGTPRRQGRLFRFSLRALLFLMLVSAIACGCVTNRLGQKRREEAAIKSFGEKVDATMDYKEVSTVPGASHTEPSGPDWLRKVLGQTFFNNIESLRFSQVIDDDLKGLAGLEHVPRIYIDGNRANFGWCGSVPELTGPEISDAGLAYVGRMTHLRELRIGSANVTDVGLAQLRGLTELRELTIAGAPFTDAGLAHLNGLAQLEKLSISLPRQPNGQETAFSDQGLEQLRGLTRLKELKISFDNITDVGMAHLGALAQLEELTILNDKITDDGLKHLQSLTHLKRLHVSLANITDVGMAHLAGLTQVEELVLHNDKITDAGLKHLQSLAHVTRLSLSCRQSDETLELQTISK